jgi:hypothetical protein
MPPIEVVTLLFSEQFDRPMVLGSSPNGAPNNDKKVTSSVKAEGTVGSLRVED